MRIKQIKNEEDNRAALTRIEELWDCEPDTPDSDELEALITLVQDFEETHYPIDAPSLIEAIRFRVEQQGSDPS